MTEAEMRKELLDLAIFIHQSGLDKHDIYALAKELYDWCHMTDEDDD